MSLTTDEKHTLPIIRLRIMQRKNDLCRNIISYSPFVIREDSRDFSPGYGPGFRRDGNWIATIIRACMLTAALYAYGSLLLAADSALAGNSSRKVVTASYAAATIHPKATMVAEEILKRGGSAADAAIAAYLVLGLVYPQAASIAGGGMAMYYDRETGRINIYDATEIAPEHAGQYLFTGPDGKPLTKKEAVTGGRAVGVPGFPALVTIMHHKHGRLPWSDLFMPALVLSENGFKVTQELEEAIRREAYSLGKYSEGRQYFFTAFGNPRKAGEILVNPAYTITLRQLLTGGYDAFYEHDFAKDIVSAVQNRAYDNRGLMSIEDITGYMAVRHDPLCIKYRNRKVCSAGPPSAAGTWLMETLGLLKAYDLSSLNPASSGTWDLIAKASRLAWLDRSAFVADPDFSPIDSFRPIETEYLEKRREHITTSSLPEQLKAGLRGDEILPADTGYEDPSGTAVLAVDSKGNAVSLVAGIRDPFGSHLFINGMLLNGALTRFSFKPSDENGTPYLNRVEGGKRPRAAIAPVMIFNSREEPVLLLGAPGGSRNAARLLHKIIAYIDWNKTVEEITAMNDIAVLDNFQVSSGSGTLARSLEKKGHKVTTGSFPDNIFAIKFPGSRR